MAALNLPTIGYAKDNTLTPTEKSAGWQLLFDGESFKGWRGYGAKAMPEAGWKIEHGLLSTVAKVRGSAIITEKKFNDFELSWEWKVELAGNNGVKYFVTESRPKCRGSSSAAIGSNTGGMDKMY